MAKIHAELDLCALPPTPDYSVDTRTGFYSVRRTFTPFVSVQKESGWAVVSLSAPATSSVPVSVSESSSSRSVRFLEVGFIVHSG